MCQGSGGVKRGNECVMVVEGVKRRSECVMIVEGMKRGN